MGIKRKFGLSFVGGLRAHRGSLVVCDLHWLQKSRLPHLKQKPKTAFDLCPRQIMSISFFCMGRHIYNPRAFSALCMWRDKTRACVKRAGRRMGA